MLGRRSTCDVDGGTRYGARCALLARASRKHPLRIAKGQTEGIPSAATLLSCVGLSVFCTRKCNSQGPLLDLALTQSLTWPPSALIDHFTRARGPAVLREEMYGTFGAHAFLSPIRFREASTKVHHPGCSGLPVLTGILYPGGPPRPAYPVSAVKARLGGGAASPGNVYPTPGWVGGGVGCLEEDPRVMSMVERDMGLAALCSREHRGSILFV